MEVRYRTTPDPCHQTTTHHQPLHTQPPAYAGYNILFKRKNQKKKTLLFGRAWVKSKAVQWFTAGRPAGRLNSKQPCFLTVRGDVCLPDCGWQAGPAYLCCSFLFVFVYD